ncbi:MAG: Nif11-like leader peptide family natural product precursor [Chlorobiales bacterium]|nr:Nif11-like leader peptide family natural product precursor [Chlorobiales bacterium]
MSVGAAKQYLYWLDKDREFAQKVRGASTEKERWAVIRDAGFDFSPEDLEAARKQEKRKGESSDNLNIRKG